MSGLFQRPKIAVAQAVKPPAPMPDDQDPSVIEARRREQMRRLQSGGRQSTILTGGGGGGGFDSYGSSKLG